ncbi:MAG: hypothetical protein JNN28_04285 [Saprospiraceae bacterium]|nr:hypothetical protein [Saprospiraceae bacterium]
MLKSAFFPIIFLLFQHCNTPMDDTLAIQQLLEKESASWRSADFQTHSDCWHIQPYSRILVSTPTGETYDVPPALMKDPNAKMGDGGSSENSQYQMCIKGDFAWVNHDEVSVARDGRKTYSHEIRILEKIDGAWKLVGQSVHMYKSE